MGIGDWGLGIGDWGLGIGAIPQSPIPNPHFDFPKNYYYNENLYIFYYYYKKIIKLYK